MPAELVNPAEPPKLPSTASTPDYDDAWRQWRAAPTPQASAKLLQDLDPVITRSARAHVGDVNPVVKGRARILALQAVRSYDPSRGTRLTSHLYNHLQGLKRYAAQATAGVHVPERVVLDRRALSGAYQELYDRLGRDPTDDELADHSGFSVGRIARVRGASPGVSEGAFAAAGEAAGGGGEGGPDDPAVRQAPSTAWARLVVNDLGPLDQLVFEYDKAGMPNGRIAQRLRRSPGWVSQRKLAIQQALDREADLSPF